MLTGEAAFSGSSPTEAIASVLRDDVELDQLPAGTPESLRRLLSRCLEKDLGRRLEHIGDARAELVPDEKTSRQLAWLIAVGAAVAVLVYWLLR